MRLTSEASESEPIASWELVEPLLNLENEQKIKQIHFKHGLSYSMAYSGSDQISNFFGLLKLVLEFSETYKKDLEILDITTSPSIIQPLVIVTLKFKDSFIKEAISKYNKILNEKGQFILPCFEKSSIEEIEQLIGQSNFDLKSKIFFKTCDFDFNKIDGYLKSSESVHSKNIQDSIEWIEENNFKIISKNFDWTSDGNKSICIIWYFDFDKKKNLKEKFSLLEEIEEKSSFNSIDLYPTEESNPFKESEDNLLHHQQQQQQLEEVGEVENQFGNEKLDEEEDSEELLLKVQDKNNQQEFSNIDL